ncbi:haloalkane dehalogenase [Microtetraspora sp. NBRC 13810]|uniref:haloalkane dehalogenase n=1 Tax=Microtetraspora sp. NBRC 13810 TaxID=3030990 RepID=UPI0024A53A19|nr:haloalkane dehalogenase [Microtetraspora sp. NBRC 13810]GLW07025.1 haloalkane dehalogenase [Microtetraspora sp. NBRC 13810]
MPGVEVLGSHMAYTEAGVGGPPVVFLHGNPTSSHLWRDVVPHVADRRRTLAPDLIGMGASGKPDIGYRFADHARYLDAWFEALDLGEVVLVGHDWGGALAMDRAARHPGRVRGLVLVETFLRPQTWAELGPDVADWFRSLRTPGLGETLVLEHNVFIEGGGLTSEFSTRKGIAEEDLAVYRAPYPDAASRRPLLQWPREAPFDGEPADVAARFDAYGRWLAGSPEVPKLLLTVEPQVGIASPEVVAWAAETVADLDIEPVGPAGHHAPEDQPDAIGRAIARWLDRTA